MAFTKGASGNPKGKPRGAKNKLTSELQQRIKGFISDNYNDFVRTYKQLPAEEKVKIYVALLKYGVPTMTHAHIEFDYRNLSERQLDYLLLRMIEGDVPALEDIQHTPEIFDEVNIKE